VCNSCLVRNLNSYIYLLCSTFSSSYFSTFNVAVDVFILCNLNLNLLTWLPLSCYWFIILPNPVPVTQARKRWNVAARLACVMAAAESVSSVSFGSSHTAATAARGTGEAISEGRVVETRTFSPANTLVAPKLPLTGIIDRRANMAEQCFAVVGTPIGCRL